MNRCIRSSAYITRRSLGGEHGPALSLANQVLEIAHGQHKRSALAMAHYAQALPCHYLGDLAGAREHFLRAIEHHRQGDFAGLPFAVADPIFGSLIFGAANEWQLGYPEKALCCVNAALGLARREANPTAGAFALSTCCYVYQLGRDYKRALEASNEGVRLATASELPLLNSLGGIYNAWARAQRGEVEDAVGQIREALAQFDAMNFHLARSAFLGLLGEAQALSGAVDDALVTVHQALQTNPDELIFRPDLLRTRGQLRVQSDSESAANLKLAELDFQEAIELARRLGANRSNSERVRAWLGCS